MTQSSKIVCSRHRNAASISQNNRNLPSGIIGDIEEDQNLSKNRLHFVSEPESIWTSADGRKVIFKCVISPPEATIKWLLNGTIITNESYEWIKINDNKLTIRLHQQNQKSFEIDLPPQNEEEFYDRNTDDEQNDSDDDNHFLKSNRASNQNINLQGVVFQCVAELDGLVIVSQPAKLIIAKLDSFDSNQEDQDIVAIAGNNVMIPCDLPHSIPLAVAEFEFNNKTIINNNNNPQGHYRILPSGHLLIVNAKPSDSGSYRCIAHNPFLQEKMFANYLIRLKVTKHKQATADIKRLKFTLFPKQQITAILETNITLECVAHGFPVPKISWTKLNGELPKSRSFIDNGVLIITSVQKEDEGNYSCSVFNSKSTQESTTELKIYEMPQIQQDDYEVIEIDDGQNHELRCDAKGQPRPLISWLHNGYFIDPQITNDVLFNQDQTEIRIINADPRIHSGIYQCFATNELGTTYAIKVIRFKRSISNSPKQMDHKKLIESSQQESNRESNIYHDQSSDFDDGLIDFNDGNVGATINGNENYDENVGHKRKKDRNKNVKLIPPSKPEISKLNDDSVIVRWSVPKNTGLPIMFFKVQYRELGHGNWMTVDVDIPPHITSYSVCCLNSNSTYRFRIAAVYSNDDNKNGKSSNKFVFQKDPLIKRPIHPPTILNASSLSSNEIVVVWEYFNLDMQPIDGFFIHYRAVDSAGQYLMVSVTGSEIRQQNVSFLLPNTAYEIKMQSFNDGGTSEFSNIYTIKTLPVKSVMKEKDKNFGPKLPPSIETNGAEKFFTLDMMRLIAFVTIAIAATLILIACLAVCFIRQKSRQSSKIRKEKIKSPSDYYFTSINNYDRRLSKGQLKMISTAQSGDHLASKEENDSESNGHPPNSKQQSSPLPNNHQLTTDASMSFNRRNYYRNSLSYSTHHIYSSNNNIKTANECFNGNAIGTIATIDRKRSIKHSLPSDVLKQYSNNHKINGINLEHLPSSSNHQTLQSNHDLLHSNHHLNSTNHQHHSTSFTRLNGTLERKRRSRHDLNGIDKTIQNRNSANYLLTNSIVDNLINNIANNDRHQSNKNNIDVNSHSPASNGNRFVIMQSSC
ncbi:hypothetical protein NH340_JMT05856 [Sarcoptes scabiei]|nr:hypothetical protein NH340_JMT05856 [Sarcoptes scabiei]